MTYRSDGKGNMAHSASIVCYDGSSRVPSIVKRYERRRPMILAQLLVNGVALGAAYALVALGFVLVLNATGAVNFAQGDLVMAGGFLAVALAGRDPRPRLRPAAARDGPDGADWDLPSRPSPTCRSATARRSASSSAPSPSASSFRTAPPSCSGRSRRPHHPCSAAAPSPLRPPDPRTVPRHHRDRRPADRRSVLAVRPYATGPPPAGDGAGPRHGARLRHSRNDHDRPDLRAGRIPRRGRRAAAVQPSSS